MSAESSEGESEGRVIPKNKRSIPGLTPDAVRLAIYNTTIPKTLLCRDGELRPNLALFAEAKHCPEKFFTKEISDMVRSVISDGSKEQNGALSSALNDVLVRARSPHAQLAAQERKKRG